MIISLVFWVLAMPANAFCGYAYALRRDHENPFFFAALAALAPIVGIYCAAALFEENL